MSAVVKEYNPSGGDKVMVWWNDRDETKFGYCLENVPRHIAPDIANYLNTRADFVSPEAQKAALEWQKVAEAHWEICQRVAFEALEYKKCLKMVRPYVAEAAIQDSGLSGRMALDKLDAVLENGSGGDIETIKAALSVPQVAPALEAVQTYPIAGSARTDGSIPSAGIKSVEVADTREALDIDYRLDKMPNGKFVGEVYHLTHAVIKDFGCKVDNDQFCAGEKTIRDYVWKSCQRAALLQEARDALIDEAHYALRLVRYAFRGKDDLEIILGEKIAAVVHATVAKLDAAIKEGE
jgi:hypothetical protein